MENKEIEKKIRETAGDPGELERLLRIAETAEKTAGGGEKPVKEALLELSKSLREAVRVETHKLIGR